MGKLIGLAGRKESGKTELAKICNNYGYKTISFALPLKTLIANLLGITIEDVNKLKNANNRYVLQNMDFIFISKETDIPLEIVKEKCEEKIFKNTRELLQFIGTDLIREYCNDWHVNKVKEMILNEPNQNFVIDDVRFPNEREMIESLNGTLWFVVRPKFENVSNHISETALKWQEFDNIIINNKSLEFLKHNWNMFFEQGYEESLKSRHSILYKLYGDKENIEALKKVTNNFTILNALFISKYEFTYNARYRNNEHVLKVEQKEDFVNVYLDDNSIDIVSNPLIIEDLKIYL